MARNYKNIDASVNKFIDMADAAINSVECMQLRAKDVKPAMQLIVRQFQIMEDERFARQGQSPYYGHYEKWRPLSDRTLKNRYARFGIETTDPLNVTGMLRRAAVNPQVAYSPHGAIIGVNVRATAKEFGLPQGMSQDYWDMYSRKRDYGIYHQSEGEALRPFVGINTPQFRKIAKKIVASYVWGVPIEEFNLRQKAIKRGGAAIKNERFERYVAARKDRNARRKTGELQLETQKRYERGYTTPAQRQAKLEEKMRNTHFESFEHWIETQHPHSGEWLYDVHGLTWYDLGGKTGYEKFAAAARMHGHNYNEFMAATDRAGISKEGTKFYRKYGNEYAKQTGNLK